MNPRGPNNTVTDEHVAVLRALLHADLPNFERIVAGMDPSTPPEGLSVLFAAAFCEAVYRRFADGYTIPDIIELVAGMRIKTLDGDEPDVNPTVAEQMILAALRNSPLENVDELDKAIAQIFLVQTLVDAENLDDAGLEAFLNDARKLADSIPFRA